MGYEVGLSTQLALNVNQCLLGIFLLTSAFYKVAGFTGKDLYTRSKLGGETILHLHVRRFFHKSFITEKSCIEKDPTDVSRKLKPTGNELLP